MKEFVQAVVHIQKYNGVENEGPNQKCAAKLLLIINKKLFELAALIQKKPGGIPIIKVMEHYDIKFNNCDLYDTTCCICNNVRQEMINIVLPSEHGLLTGFFVCNSKDKECINLILHVYNLAHFENRCKISENIEKTYNEFLSDLDSINSLIDKFSL